jgi:uncharacterized membrane protein (UPF0182 family)
VEPIYLQSKSNDLPTLVRVVVTDGRRFVMERSLRRALERLVEQPRAQRKQDDSNPAPPVQSLGQSITIP